MTSLTPAQAFVVTGQTAVVGRRLQPSRTDMRPFTSTISLEEARRRLDAAVRPIARTERVRARGRRRASGRRRRDVADRRAAVRAVGDGRLRGDRGGHQRRLAIDTRSRLRLLDRIYTGQLSSVTVTPGHLRRDRDRRAAAGRRGRGGDGRGDREERRPRHRRLRVGRRRAERRPPRRGHRRRRPRGRGRRSAVAQPRRRAGRDRLRGRRGVRPAARRDPLDRQRGDRAGTTAVAGPDLRRQPLHARRDRLDARRRPRGRIGRRRTPSTR